MSSYKNNSYLISRILMMVFCCLCFLSVQADRASKVEALKPLKGLCYVPYTSDWSSNHGNGQKYFDTDYTNNFFPLLWGTANNGRGDIKTFHALGVNFLRLYDWSAPPNPLGSPLTQNLRNHLPFLNECQTYGIKVTIPFSNYNVFNIENSGTPWIVPNVQAMVEEAYNGGKTPHPAAAMLAVGNEIFLNVPGKDYDLAAQYAIKIVETILLQEGAMGINDDNKLLITLPISTSTLGQPPPTGGVYGLRLIKQYAAASAICTAHNFLTDRYIISLNVEMNGAGSKSYLEDIKSEFPGTPILFTEFGTGRDEVASELEAVISSESPFQYFDDSLLGVSVFTWVGEPGQKYPYPIAQVEPNPEGTTGIIEPTNYNPGGGETYPVDKIKKCPVFYAIQNIYTSQSSITVSSGTTFSITMPAAVEAEGLEYFRRNAGASLEYDFIKKPIVFIQNDDGRRFKARIITKNFPTDEVKCRWTKRISPGIYSLYVEVDGIATLITDYFKVSAPVIDEVVRNDSVDDFIIEVRGNYFGKRPKLYYTFKDLEGRKRSLKCKIIKESRSNEENLGYAVLRAKYPKKVLNKFQNGEISVNPVDEGSGKRLRRRTDLPLGFTIRNRIGDTTSNPVPGSVLANNSETIWFVDKQQVAGKAYYNFLFRGSEPLTAATSVDEQTLDLETLVTTMAERYDAQNPGAAVAFPTTFKLIDVSLIGFAGSVHDGVGEAPYLFREFVSFGGDSSLGDTTFIMPGDYQPSGSSWYSFPSPPAGYTISGRLLWQPVGGITPTQSNEYPSNVNEGSAAANMNYAKDNIFDQAWSRPAFNYIPTPHTPPTFAANKFYGVMENVINEMAADNDEATIIYVHCMHGHDRTTSVTVSYLLNQAAYENNLPAAVDEKFVPGTSLMDTVWPFKHGKISKGKVFKYPYGMLVEWYYIYLFGKYSAIQQPDQEGTWPEPPTADEETSGLLIRLRHSR